jgi:uncharacterized membrane protein YjgN (DUF898 family)
MTAVEVAHPARIPAVPVSPVEISPPGAAAARFHGSERAFLELLVRGSMLLLITLGIYRFWLATDVRRFLWGNVEAAGDSLEYSGTPRELLIGFLMALALLTPVYVLFFIAALDMGLASALSGAFSFVFLALLGQFAVYRARRYRLTRTIFRGVRLYQTGSAWRYAFTSAFWWLLTLLTAGLAYPWLVTALERYKMRHTHYGNLAGRFEGSGVQLFMRGIALWAVVMVPLLAGLAITLTMIEWKDVLPQMVSGGDDLWARAIVASMVTGLALTWAALAAVVLYPAFRSIVLRWWISGLRLGDVRATSRLRTRQIYRVYLRFLCYSMLFGIVIGVVGSTLVFSTFGALTSSFGKSAASEIAAIAISVGTYVIALLGYSVIYQATVTIGFWRLSFETTELSGLEALDKVEARGAAGSPFGEGLADALDVGGL